MRQVNKGCTLQTMGGELNPAGGLWEPVWKCISELSPLRGMGDCVLTHHFPLAIGYDCSGANMHGLRAATRMNTEDSGGQRKSSVKEILTVGSLVYQCTLKDKA